MFRPLLASCTQDPRCFWWLRRGSENNLLSESRLIALPISSPQSYLERDAHKESNYASKREDISPAVSPVSFGYPVFHVSPRTLSPPSPVAYPPASGAYFRQSVKFWFRDFSSSKLFHFFYGIGIGFGNFWYRKKYRYRFQKNLVSKKVSVSVSEKIWYRKKYRIRYRKKLVSEKSFGFGFVQILGFFTHCVQLMFLTSNSTLLVARHCVTMTLSPRVWYFDKAFLGFLVPGPETAPASETDWGSEVSTFLPILFFQSC